MRVDVWRDALTRHVIIYRALIEVAKLGLHRLLPFLCFLLVLSKIVHE